MADNAPKTPQDVAAICDERDVRFIRLWFTDILGQLKSFSINRQELEDAFEGGMGFDGSSITGFNPIEESDMIAMPDPSTFYDPALAARGQGDRPHVLRRAGAGRRALRGRPALGDAPRRSSGCGGWASTSSTSGRSSSTSTSARPRPTADRREVLDKGGYFDLTTLDAGSDLRRETVLALEQLGIHVEYSHHEVGPSQHEVDMRYADALKMCDDCMTYRITVKEYAMKYGFYATFMPKPLYGENGSGMHVHQSLFKGGRNAFYDANDQYYLSDVAKSFIAGQLKHAREMSALFAQWVNSYKRLVPGYEAPVYVAWSRRNRSALIRVPLYHPGKEQATRCEIRCPDPRATRTCASRRCCRRGWRASRRATSCPSRWNATSTTCRRTSARSSASSSCRRRSARRSRSPPESELILKTLGEHVFTRFIEIKRQEWEDYRTQLSAWEMEKYLPVL